MLKIVEIPGEALKFSKKGFPMNSVTTGMTWHLASNADVVQ